MWLIIAIIVLAALGLLGAVLKAVLLVIGAIVLTVVVAGWLGYRSLKKQVAAQAQVHRAPPGTTTIVIGDAARDDDPPASLPGGRDDRY